MRSICILFLLLMKMDTSRLDSFKTFVWSKDTWSNFKNFSKNQKINSSIRVFERTYKLHDVAHTVNCGCSVDISCCLLKIACKLFGRGSSESQSDTCTCIVSAIGLSHQSYCISELSLKVGCGWNDWDWAKFLKFFCIFCKMSTLLFTMWKKR